MVDELCLMRDMMAGAVMCCCMSTLQWESFEVRYLEVKTDHVLWMFADYE